MWKEYRLRRVILSLFFVVAIGFVALVFYVPSLMLTISKQKEVVNRIEAVKRSTLSSEADSLNKELTVESLKIKALEVPDNSMSVSELIGNILADKGDNIRVKSVAYKRGVGIESKIILSGFAKDRDSLLGFTQTLENGELFEKVDLPVSSFAKDKNLDFSVSVSGKF